MTQQLSRSLVMPPKPSCLSITKSLDYLAYVIQSHGSDFQIVKIIHRDSREYAIIQQSEGSIASIALNHLDLLAVLDDNYMLKIYSNQFIDKKVV
ncbi:hypothetical protein MXB_712 [Myxobolus squamalis]|nr:hypothetical protein MXB_712 [Myxobolus squamalis]